MTQMPIIERVARILCDQDYGDPDQVVQGEGAAVGRTWLGWQAYHTQAVRILRVMREPTPKILASGIREEDWKRAVDAALEEVASS